MQNSFRAFWQVQSSCPFTHCAEQEALTAISSLVREE